MPEDLKETKVSDKTEAAPEPSVIREALMRFYEGTQQPYEGELVDAALAALVALEARLEELEQALLGGEQSSPGGSARGQGPRWDSSEPEPATVLHFRRRALAAEKALAAYRSALLSGEPETDQLRALLPNKKGVPMDAEYKRTEPEVTVVYLLSWGDFRQCSAGDQLRFAREAKRLGLDHLGTPAAPGLESVFGSSE